MIGRRPLTRNTARSACLCHTLPEPQGSQLAARRACRRPGSANNCATAPSEGTLHRVGFINPQGRASGGRHQAKPRRSDWRPLYETAPYVNPKGHAVGPAAGVCHCRHACHATASCYLGIAVLRIAHWLNLQRNDRRQAVMCRWHQAQRLAATHDRAATTGDQATPWRGRWWRCASELRHCGAWR